MMTCQIGKELLLPELPLTVRLIGLRVTKLKDLHAPEPVDGIKRVSPEKVGEQTALETANLVLRGCELVTEEGKVGGRHRGTIRT